MKYLTKEWFDIMRCANLHLSLKPLEEARIFSETLFETLYAEREQDYLDFQKLLCDGNPERTFEPEKLKEAFRERHLAELEEIEYTLPGEIIQKIADPRVYAFGYASPEIIDAVAAYSRSCDQYVRQTLRECEERTATLLTSRHSTFSYSDGELHDYPIKSAHFSEKDFILECRESRGENLIFKNAEILVQERNLAGSFIKYTEIYPAGMGYEFHFLVRSSASDGFELFYLTIRCANFETRRQIELLNQEEPT